MPAIETLLTGPVAATEPAGTPPETTSGGADDFEQAMQQALAPGGKKLPEKTAAPPMGRSLPPTPSAGETLPAEFLAVENPSEKSAPSAEKKTDETPAPKLADALNPTPVLWLPPVDYSMPPGVSLLLPSSGDFPVAAKAAPVTGEKNVAAEILAAVPGVAEKVLPKPAGPDAGQKNPAEKISENKMEPKKLTPGKNPASVLVPPPAVESALIEPLPLNLADPAAAPQTDLPSPLTVRGKLDLSQPPVVTVAAVNTGTGVASTVPEMKNSDKVDFFAGLTGQKLPEAGPARSVAAALSSLPEFPAHASGKFSSEFAAPFAGAGTGSSSVSSAEATTQMNVLALPSLTEARLNTVERAHDLVSLHALRLVETRADAMSVVLKPGAGTELSLELRQRNGVIEASAVLAQGDYQLLNQHWADLQARLELRGIKLGPLGGEAGFNSGGGNFSQQRSPARDEETESAAAFAEFAALAGGASARRMPALRGWESWA